MKEYTTAEIFEELWKRIEYDANVSEELATESNELQERIDKAIEIIDLIKPELWNISNAMTHKLIDIKNILKGEDRK